ncbi:hypothetical protein TGRH88_085730 [Toxoplasma gondii]|uniref:Uncharacterized protein n=1 Tax=Toxoplasma gondii TaxID=5811 RepID=A0A7J6KIH4_TOXGO|nr:hypothetical protein TGRH88_085730 [Toxoplasma gondii]
MPQDKLFQSTGHTPAPLLFTWDALLVQKRQEATVVGDQMQLPARVVHGFTLALTVIGSSPERVYHRGEECGGGTRHVKQPLNPKQICLYLQAREEEISRRKEWLNR